jgi:TonB family protein
MDNFLRERKRNENRSKLLGAGLAVVVHVLLLLTLSFNGLNYIYPPPAESTFLLDFTDEIDETPEKPRIISRKIEPRAEEVNRTKPVELVKRSNINDATSGDASNPAPTGNDYGDVETPAQPEETVETIDPRSLFPGRSKKTDSAGEETKKEVDGGRRSDGNPDGNAPIGKMEGVPNAHLEGRTSSSLPRPVYNEQESGTVVVTIWVNQYGDVEKAQAGAPGTTTSSPALWAAARAAAMKSKFKMKADAPALQEGTITYVFKLN